MESDGETERAIIFGQRVRERRKALGWTQAELAEAFFRIGAPVRELEISRRESGRGKLTVNDLFAYSWALRCAPVDLLVGDDGYVQVTPHSLQEVRRPLRTKP